MISGAADDHAALIVTGLTCTREPVQSALEEFARKGGAVLTDMATGKEIAGAKQLPFAFPDVYSRWHPYKPTDADRQGDRAVFERFIRPNIKVLAGELEALVKPFARCDNPMFMLSEQGAGYGRYVWVVNTTREKARNCQWQPAAASGRITLPATVPVVYDVFARKQIQEREFDLKLEAGDAALFALFPEAIKIVGIDNVEFRAPMLQVEVSIHSRVRLIRAVFPVEIELIDPDGERVMIFRRGTRAGKVVEAVPLGNAPREGTWRIVARETITGRSTAARFEVRGSREAFAFVENVRMLQPERIEQSLRPSEAVLVLAADELTRMAATPLQAVLKQDRSEVAIGDAGDYLTPIERDPKLPYFGGKPPLAIDKQVVLLGNRRTNPLIRKLTDDYGLAPPPLNTGRRLSAGRSLVFHVTGAFGINRDTVVVYADDPKGLERGVKALAGLLRGHPKQEKQQLDAE
jgi:hypothetical protein